VSSTAGPITLLGGKYTRAVELGRGGMGVVYKAYYEPLDRTVAIKCLNRELVTNQEFTARFTQEARVVAKLSHENVVSVYDIEEFQGDKYIIMEFIEGESLGGKIDREKRIAIPQAISIIRQTARALHHAHEAGVIHRDVKPDNIMITRRGQVKVMDFGIARVSGSGQNTRTGLAIGTPHYMSPEQIEGRKDIDRRSDVYSLSVVLFYICTGQLPFDDENTFTLAMKHIAEPPPRPSFIYPQIPPQLEAIILRGMAKQPDDRYQTAELLDQALAIFEFGGNTQNSLAGMSQGFMQAQSIPVPMGGYPGAPMGMPGSMSDMASAYLNRTQGDQPALRPPMNSPSQPFMPGQQGPPSAYQQLPFQQPPYQQSGYQQMPQMPQQPWGGASGVSQSQMIGQATPPAGLVGQSTPVANPALQQPSHQRAVRRGPEEEEQQGASMLTLIIVFVMVVAIGALGALWFIKNRSAVVASPQDIQAIVIRVDNALNRSDATEAAKLLNAAMSTYGRLPALTNLEGRLAKIQESMGGGAMGGPLSDTEVRALDSMILAAGLDVAQLTMARGELEKKLALYPREPRLNELASYLEGRERKAKALDQTRQKMDELISKDRYEDAYQVIIENERFIDDKDQSEELVLRVKTAQENALDFQKRRILGLIDRGKFEDARIALSEARQRFPLKLDDWDQLDAQLRTAQSSSQFEQSRGAAMRELESQFKTALEEGLFDLAEDVSRRILAATPAGTPPKDYIKIISDAKVAKVQEYMSFGQSLEAAGENLSKALEYYEKALAIAPGDTKVLQAVTQLKSKLKSSLATQVHLDAAKKLMAAGDLISLRQARERLKTAREGDLGNELVREMLSLVESRITELEKPQALTRVEITDSAELIASRKRAAPTGYIYIPGGNYRIGSDSGGANAKPSQIVHVNGFYLYYAEVSVKDYKEFCQRMRRSMPVLPPGDGLEYLPITRVSRKEAEEFARAVGARLPTEFEWEVAARTADAWEFTTGPDWQGRRVNHADNGAIDGQSSLAEVNSPNFRDGWREAGYANGLRALNHMGGNVAEWTSSSYKPYPGGTDRLDDYGKDGYGVIRGGSYQDSSRDYFRTHSRRAEPERLSLPWVGFRLAKDP
jgi:serine/threonine protein kinase/formylglycine-generating enzyme required for sulfatase activity